LGRASGPAAPIVTPGAGLHDKRPAIHRLLKLPETPRECMQTTHIGIVSKDACPA